MYRRYYQALGIQEGASKQEVKKAYYKKAKQYHPDVNKDPKAVQRFLEAQEAFEVLYNNKPVKHYGTRHSNFSHAARRSSYAHMKREMRREAHRKKYGSSHRDHRYRGQHKTRPKSSHGPSHTFRKSFFKEEYGTLAKRICYGFYGVLMVFGAFLVLLPLVVLIFFTDQFASTSSLISLVMGWFILRFANDWYVDLKRDFASH